MQPAPPCSQTADPPERGSGEPTAAERLASFDREIARLNLGVAGAGWPIVAAACDEAQGLRYLLKQVERYESSVSRLHQASRALEENCQMYTRTLESVRPKAEDKAGELPGKYVCASEKLYKKDLLAKGSLPEIEGVDPKLVAKYWPKASFTFELKAQGEIAVSAAVKGRVMWEASLRLDELLKQRAEGVRAIEEEGVEIQLAALLQLIDDKFYSRRK